MNNNQTLQPAKNSGPKDYHDKFHDLYTLCWVQEKNGNLPPVELRQAVPSALTLWFAAHISHSRLPTVTPETLSLTMLTVTSVLHRSQLVIPLVQVTETD